MNIFCVLEDCNKEECHHCFPVKNCSFKHDFCKENACCNEIDITKRTIEIDKAAVRNMGTKRNIIFQEGNIENKIIRIINIRKLNRASIIAFKTFATTIVIFGKLLCLIKAEFSKYSDTDVCIIPWNKFQIINPLKT